MYRTLRARLKRNIHVLSTKTELAKSFHPLINRKTYRTDRHSQISRWETTEETDYFGIESWMKRQTQLKLKRDCPKARQRKNKESKAVSLPQSDDYTLPVQKKCSAIENVQNFESQSLHKSLISSPPSKKWKQSVSRDRKSVLPQFKYVTKDSKPDAYVHSENLKVRTDKDFSNTNDGRERGDNTGESNSRLTQLPEKRSRSAPETQPKNSELTDEQRTTSYHKIKGISTFSKFGEIRYKNGKGYSNLDEDDDEGYSSKTSSAEAKEKKELSVEFPFRRMCTSMIDLSLLPSHIKEKEVPQSKFKLFYTHLSKKLQGNNDIDNEEEGDDESGRKMSKSKTMHPLDAGKLLRRRTQDGSKVSVQPVENTAYFKFEEMKQVRLVLRKITIQDSDEANAGTFPVGERAGKLDPIPNIDRSRLSSRSSTASRKQQGTSSRPYSNKTEPLQKSAGRHSVNIQKFEHENSHPPYSIGDLIPAMDRNIYNSRRTRTFDSLTKSREESLAKREGVVSNSLNNPLPKKLLISPTNGLMFLRKGLDFMTENIEKEQYALTPSQGRPLGGKPKESKSRVPVLPDKETKKKLQDALSKFYNKKSHIIGPDLIRGLKNMWKS